MKRKNKSIQLAPKLHKTLSRDLIRLDGIKTFGGLINYYRTVANLYLKKLKEESEEKK
jgi:hypothetical protein